MRAPQSATGLLYAAAGTPPVATDTAGQCRLCGHDGPGVQWGRWVRETFADIDRAGPGSVICAACWFCWDDHSAILQQRTGRDKPQRMRNYSHLVTSHGAWLPLGKDQKRTIAHVLTSTPLAVAAISTAGQKHVLFRARAGWWQFEELAVRPDPAQLARLLDPVTALYGMGATKGMLRTGEYGTTWLRRVDLAVWWHHEQAIRRDRGSPLFELAVWLTQREDSDDASA